MSENRNLSSIIMNYDKLKGRANYQEWRFVMRNALVFDNLWSSITGYDKDDKSTPEARKRDSDKALSKIYLSVERSCFSHLMQANTAKEAWEILEKTYDDKGLNRRLTLLRSILSVKLIDHTDMEAYVNAIQSLAQQLENMKKPLDDEFLAALLLQGLPDSYEPMIMALEHSCIQITSDLIKTKLLQDKIWTGNDIASNNC